MTSPVTDSKAFRFALGKFPTGVTIITCKTASGENVGMTASSFNSVSLEPPLILWSIDKNSYSLKAFTECTHFAVHVLHQGQVEQSNLFASQGVDKFSQVETEVGIENLPLLTDFNARFQCMTEHQYEGGDHIIIVGRVLDFEANDKAPLVFHAGRYAAVNSAVN